MGVNSHKTFYRVAMSVLIVMLSGLTVVAKSTDDVVTLRNGDRITGEIKRLQHGELEFKASYMAESVLLDWTKVARLETKDMYLISLVGGQRFSDHFKLVDGPSGADNFQIGPVVKINPTQVVGILPIEANFWRQLTGSIDLGLNFTSANEQYQAEILAEVTYRKGFQTLTAAVDSAFSGQTKGSRTARNQVTINYQKQLSRTWYVGGLFDALRSDQQSLQLRLTGGGLLGRNLIQTERTRLSTFGGLAVSHEKYSVPVNQPRSVNTDALAGLDFVTFRFSATDISSRLLVYPSLTTPGRVRTQLRSDLSIKLAKDLWWGLHLYENYDGKPPTNTKKNDLGITASIGWKF